MKAILFPTDFSYTTNRALNYAAHIARNADIPLILLHVCNLIDYSFPGEEELYREFNEEKKKEALQKLYDLRNRVESTGKIKILIELYDGDFVESVLQVIQEYHVSLIVMGMVGSGGLLCKLIGSKTAILMRKSPVPVLGVPKSNKRSIARHIVMAVEEDERISENINTALELTTMFADSMQVLHFSKDKQPVYELIKEKRTLHNFTSSLKKKYSNVKIDEVMVGGKSFTNAFDDYANNHPVDLIIMLSHHRDWLDQLTGKSTTQKIIRNTLVPILVLPSNNRDN